MEAQLLQVRRLLKQADSGHSRRSRSDAVLGVAGIDSTQRIDGNRKAPADLPQNRETQRLGVGFGRRFKNRSQQDIGCPVPDGLFYFLFLVA